MIPLPASLLWALLLEPWQSFKRAACGSGAAGCGPPSSPHLQMSLQEAGRGLQVCPLSFQVYKRAKALDQSDNDMSAVYRAYIH